MSFRFAQTCYSAVLQLGSATCAELHFDRDLIEHFDEVDAHALASIILSAAETWGLTTVVHVNGFPDPRSETRYSPLVLVIERRCRVCGCTDYDCAGCVERTGEPCHWAEDDLCSACVEVPA